MGAAKEARVPEGLVRVVREGAEPEQEEREVPAPERVMVLAPALGAVRSSKPALHAAVG